MIFITTDLTLSASIKIHAIHIRLHSPKPLQVAMKFTTTLPALTALTPTIMAAQAYVPYA